MVGRQVEETGADFQRGLYIGATRFGTWSHLLRSINRTRRAPDTKKQREHVLSDTETNIHSQTLKQEFTDINADIGHPK